jgi:hypothetical protein
MTETEEEKAGATQPQPPSLSLFPKAEKVISKILVPMGFETYPFHVSF